MNHKQLKILIRETLKNHLTLERVLPEFDPSSGGNRDERTEQSPLSRLSSIAVSLSSVSELNINSNITNLSNQLKTAIESYISTQAEAAQKAAQEAAEASGG